MNLTLLIFELVAIAAATAVACALTGTWLVLRQQALLSDAVSHAVLVGIAVGFLLTGSAMSPWLVLGAAGSGVVMVYLVELLKATRLVKQDAAIGLIFPALFALGVVLISRYAGSVHLDTDAVILGELALAPFERFVLGGLDLGPQQLWIMGSVALLDTVVIMLFFKELKISTFDPLFASSQGIRPAIMTFVLACLTSITAVAAFSAVGSVLVVALMIAPVVAAHLLTNSLPRLILLACGFGVLAALVGTGVAFAADISIGGMIALSAGALFLAVAVLAPQHGLLARARNTAKTRAKIIS